MGDNGFAAMARRAKTPEAELVATDAFDWMKRHAEHTFDCPAGRDDHECKCGLDDILQRLEAVADRKPAPDLFAAMGRPRVEFRAARCPHHYLNPDICPDCTADRDSATSGTAGHKGK